MMKFKIIIFGIFLISLAGFVNMYVYAQIKLKTTILLIILTNTVFIIIATIKL